MPDPRARFVLTAEDRATRVLKGLKGEVRMLGSSFSRLNVAIGGLVGGGALSLFLKTSIDSADKIQKLSTRLGASTEALSQYQYVTERTGVSFNTLTTGLQRSTRRIAEAAQGTGEARKALAELNLDVERLNKLAPEQQFEVLADAIQGVENPADRVRLAMKLFDSEGVALLQTMQGGSEAIRALREEADALGVTLDQETADAAAAAKDEMAKLDASTEALGIAMVRYLGPAVADVARWLAEVLPSAASIASEAFSALQQFIQESVSFVASELGGLSNRFAEVAEFVGADQIGRALRKTADDYYEAAGIAEKAAIRIGNAKELIGEPATAPRVNFADILGGGEIESAPEKSKRTGKSDAEKEAERFAKALRSLQDELDPVSAKTRDYLENVSLLDRAWAEGQISGQRYQELMAILATDVDAVREAEAALAADRERALGMIKDLDPGAVYRDQIAEVQRLRDLFPELSDALAEVELNAHDAWDAIGDEGAKAAEDVRSAWEELGPTFSSAFEDAIVEGKNLSDVLKGLEQDILRIGTRKLVTEPLGNFFGGLLGGGGTGGNFLSGLFPAFASGGSFMVGGSGGTDSQLVAFRASPNERVTVETPGQRSRKQGSNVTININGVSDYDSFRRNETQLRRQAQRFMGI